MLARALVVGPRFSKEQLKAAGHAPWIETVTMQAAAMVRGAGRRFPDRRVGMVAGIGRRSGL